MLFRSTVRVFTSDVEGADDITFVIDALGKARSDGGDVIFEGEGLAGGCETGETGQDTKGRCY